MKKNDDGGIRDAVIKFAKVMTSGPERRNYGRQQIQKVASPEKRESSESTSTSFRVSFREMFRPGCLLSLVINGNLTLLFLMWEQIQLELTSCRLLFPGY